MRILQVHRANPEIDKAIDGLDARLMGLGWLTISLGWVAFGFSLWATMQAFPPHMARPTLMDMPLLTAAVALAMVAGFLSLLPGGIGVRELVVIPLLSPAFGQVGAIVAAVVLRVSWMATELIVAGTLYLLAPGDHKSGVAIHSLREDASLMTGGKKVVELPQCFAQIAVVLGKQFIQRGVRHGLTGKQVADDSAKQFRRRGTIHQRWQQAGTMGCDDQATSLLSPALKVPPTQSP